MTEPLLHIVLHHPEIPQNAGATGRTCVAIRAKLWMVRPLGFLIDDAHVRRAGLDYWQHLDWQVVDDWSRMVEHLGDRPCWFFSKKATRLYTDVTYQPGDALIFGSESQGLPESILADRADRCLRIPIHPPARSLNVSVSAAVVAFEALRQMG